MRQGASTLAHNERRLRPLVMAVLVACTAGGAAALWLGRRPGTMSAAPWLACVALWLLPCVSNMLYAVRNHNTTVGMMPVAVFSLAPATAPALFSSETIPVAHSACAVAFLCSCVTLALFVVWFARIHAAYARPDDVSPDAVIIVLGGAVQDGVPKPSLARRLDVAQALWEEHPTRTLVLSGGPLAYEDGTEAEAMARYLVARGVDRTRLALETRARNTAQNIEFSMDLIRRRGLVGQCCALTNDYHLYRALREGRRLGHELVPIPAPTPRATCLQQWCREVLTILAKK